MLVGSRPRSPPLCSFRRADSSAVLVEAARLWLHAGLLGSRSARRQSRIARQHERLFAQGRAPASTLPFAGRIMLVGSRPRSPPLCSFRRADSSAVHAGLLGSRSARRQSRIARQHERLFAQGRAPPPPSAYRRNSREVNPSSRTAAAAPEPRPPPPHPSPRRLSSLDCLCSRQFGRCAIVNRELLVHRYAEYTFLETWSSVRVTLMEWQADFGFTQVYLGPESSSALKPRLSLFAPVRTMRHRKS
jgi:hypothetical protein